MRDSFEDLPILAEIGEALERGFARERAKSSSARRRLVPWRMPRSRAGLFAVAGVLLAGSAFAATGPWLPQLGGSDRGHPTVARSPVPSGQRVALAVLRRQQQPADRGPRVQRVLRMLVAHDIAGVHVDGVRLLGTHPGGVMVLVPARRVGSHDKGYASSIRRDVLAVLYSSTVPSRVAKVRKHDGRLVTVREPGGFVAAQAAGNLDDLLHARIAAVANSADGLHVFGLVPDGVAFVQVRAIDGTLLTAAVHDNAFDLRVGGTPPQPGVTWLDAAHRPVPH